MLAALLSLSFAAQDTDVTPAKVDAILAAVRAPGATLVVLNVWATWCEPCREEMPDILRFAQEYAERGVRLVLVSADQMEDRKQAQSFLSGALAERKGLRIVSLIKTERDADFVDKLDARWSGALPTTFLYWGSEKPLRVQGSIDYKQLVTQWKSHHKE